MKFLALKHELKSEPRKVFKEIILAAPDIDADKFRKEIAPALAKMPAKTTLYASSRDIALRASKRQNGEPRAGDSGKGIVVMKGMETIDASYVDTSLFWGLRHSYIADSPALLSDLFYLLEKKVRAHKRFGLESFVAPNGLTLWRFKQ